jgi:hypothetical protein
MRPYPGHIPIAIPLPSGAGKPESPTTMWLISQISREVKEDRRIQAES